MIVLKHIVVATDFSEPADAALAYGREMARTFGADLHLVHVVSDLATQIGVPGYVPDLSSLQQETEHAATASLEKRLSDEDRRVLGAKAVLLHMVSPSHAIIDYARALPADLVVLGTHGRGAIAHLVMGSVAEHVVRLAPCPVLTVRHPEREFVHPDALTNPAGATT